MKRVGFLLVMSGFLVGCTSRTFSTTSRTAVEQMLLSTAVDRAMEKFNVPEMKGKRIHIDFTNLKAIDAEYVKVALRARIAEQGAVLAEAADKADLTVEVASGALGMEQKTGLLGLPALPVPQSPVPFPEAALCKTVEQTAIVKLLIFVSDKGTFVARDQYFARADRDESFFLWWRFHRKDNIREGWEKADLKLHEKAQQAVAAAENAK